MTNCWRYFGRRFFSWKQFFYAEILILSVFQKYGSPTRVIRLKVAPKMADPISFKTQDMSVYSLKYHLENSRKASGLLSSFVSSRGVARLFKMRRRQGGGGEADRDSGWRLSIVPCTTCHFVWEGSRGWASKWEGSSLPAPAPYVYTLFSR